MTTDTVFPMERIEQFAELANPRKDTAIIMDMLQSYARDTYGGDFEEAALLAGSVIDLVFALHEWHQSILKEKRKVVEEE